MLKPRKAHTVVDPRWWFVCVIKSNMEMLFRKELSKYDILNFSPMKKFSFTLYGKKTYRMGPLFPNYVFVFGKHYSDFRKKINWKGLLYAINEDDENVYKMPHGLVIDLMFRQALGEFDKENDKPDVFCVGDVVDVVGDEEPEPPLYEKREIFLIRGATIISMGAKRATIISGNKVWKIKFCFLRKSVDKSSPFGEAKFKIKSPERTAPNN